MNDLKATENSLLRVADEEDRSLELKKLYISLAQLAHMSVVNDRNTPSNAMIYRAEVRGCFGVLLFANLCIRWR